MAHLRCFNFDHTTFGMEIDKVSKGFRFLKKNTKTETVFSHAGLEKKVLVAPAEALGSVMGEAHWLVTETKTFEAFTIEGFMEEAMVYIRYTDEPIDFRRRRLQILGKGGETA